MAHPQHAIPIILPDGEIRAGPRKLQSFDFRDSQCVRRCLNRTALLSSENTRDGENSNGCQYRYFAHTNLLEGPYVTS